MTTSPTVPTTPASLLCDDIFIIPGEDITRIVVSIVRSSDDCYRLDTRHVNLATKRLNGMHVTTLHFAATETLNRVLVCCDD